MLRLYTWSHALDHVVLYDDDGRAIPMVEGTETSDAGSILHTSISTAAWDRAHDATDDAPWAPAYLGLQWAGMAWKMMPMPGIDPARVAGMVCTVDPNGPAAKAGIRVGDGLVRMTTKNQIPFGPEVVQDSAGSFADPGVPLRVTILRGGDERTVTLTPARDPMFEGVIERSRSALAKLNMEMPDCRSDRISTYVFVSNSPVRAGLRASKLELWFTGNPATPRDQWREEQVTFRDIPLPKEFWAIQDARSGKSHLPR